MFIEKFASQRDSHFTINAERASAFAKIVCNDFNPIHDPENKRFCVPGDLLFAIALERYGVSEQLNIKFNGLVGANAVLIYPRASVSDKVVVDHRGRECLFFSSSGKEKAFDASVESLVMSYVRFSGHNFPDVLVPLMAEQGVMINPTRPLIIYQSMSLELDTLSFVSPELDLSGSTLEISGKRGDAHLRFDIFDRGKPIGKGVKHLILSGLRPYQQDIVDGLIKSYLKFKSGIIDL